MNDAETRLTICSARSRQSKHRTTPGRTQADGSRRRSIPRVNADEPGVLSCADRTHVSDVQAMPGDRLLAHAASAAAASRALSRGATFVSEQRPGLSRAGCAHSMHMRTVAHAPREHSPRLTPVTCSVRLANRNTRPQDSPYLRGKQFQGRGHELGPRCVASVTGVPNRSSTDRSNAPRSDAARALLGAQVMSPEEPEPARRSRLLRHPVRLPVAKTTVPPLLSRRP